MDTPRANAMTDLSKENSKSIFLIIISFVACLAGIASDIYAPSLPAISISLNASINLVQMSLAIFMLGLSISQLIYGPLSDAFGRRPILMLGLIITFVGTGICYLSPNINSLILGRFVQGCGAGACAALWRSTFRDVFLGAELAKYGSYLSVCMVFVVPAAPAFGGFLQQSFGWRSSFLILGLYLLVTLFLVAFLLKETSKHHHKSRFSKSFIISSYAELLKSRVFMGYSLCVFLTYGAFFSWFAVGPVLLINHLGHSPITFGWISFAALGGSMAIGSFLNARLIERFGIYAMLRFGWSMNFLAGALMLFTHWFMSLSTFTLVGPVVIFYLGATFIFANTFAGAFAKFGKIAGFTGALYGSFQIAGAWVLGSLVSYLPDNTQAPLGCVYVGCSSAAWLVYKKIVRPAE